ncbi:MAG: hypothetical protein FJ297_01035 [Planctomycetes bacterium]|nr:hypothetical protein [Planctomycetota bacterium]
MSLFERSGYRWRDTYFVLFEERESVKADDLGRALRALGDRYQFEEIGSNEDGVFESLTLLSPTDYAGMDIILNSGEDVAAQIEELTEELGRGVLTADDRRKLAIVKRATARFEVFHFEQVAEEADEADDDYLDPGGLLLVLERLAASCDGIVVDPQSGAFL